MEKKQITKGQHIMKMNEYSHFKKLTSHSNLQRTVQC